MRRSSPSQKRKRDRGPQPGIGRRGLILLGLLGWTCTPLEDGDDRLSGDGGTLDGSIAADGGPQDGGSPDMGPVCVPTGPENCSNGIDDDCVNGTDCADSACMEALACAVVLTDTLTENLTLTADRSWLLRETVVVGNGTDPTTLTIEPGTTVYGEALTDGTLIVQRGSKIIADGTRNAPIVFTSSNVEWARQPGDWGGIAVNGRAPINPCATQPCEVTSGGTVYGGDAPDDDSGILRYVRIEFSGAVRDGLQLRGVGRGTTVESIHIHRSRRDGIQFIGGTVDARYILVTGAWDDSVDWEDGWRGRAQFIVAQQWDDRSDSGIQAENNGSNHDASPRSRPMISNITLIGVPSSERSEFGIHFEDGTAANIQNSIVLGFNRACIDIDDPATFAHALTDMNTLTGQLTVSNSIIGCANGFQEDLGDPILVQDFVMELNTGNQLGDPGLVSPFDTNALDARPEPGSLAASVPAASVPNDGFFENVSFIGGVDPDRDWTAGWTANASR